MLTVSVCRSESGSPRSISLFELYSLNVNITRGSRSLLRTHLSSKSIESVVLFPRRDQDHQRKDCPHVSKELPRAPMFDSANGTKGGVMELLFYLHPFARLFFEQRRSNNLKKHMKIMIETNAACG